MNRTLPLVAETTSFLRAAMLVMLLALCLLVLMTGHGKANSTAPSALTGDAIWDQSQLCQSLFPRIERKEEIPIYLLSAIAVTESGREHHASGMRVPWPWTVQARGKGYYFDTKQQAVAKVRSLQASGARSIDVGCMQVNLRYHGRSFATLEEAFDPQHNVAYAAKYLKLKYGRYNSWRKALAAYHAGQASRGKPYARRVMRAWHEVMTRSLANDNSRSINPVARSRGARAPLLAQYDPENWQVQAHKESDIIVLNPTPLQESGNYPAPVPSEKPGTLQLAALPQAKPERAVPQGGEIQNAMGEAVEAAVVTNIVSQPAVEDIQRATPYDYDVPEGRKDNMLRRSDHMTRTKTSAARRQGALIISAEGRNESVRARGFDESAASPVTEDVAFRPVAKAAAPSDVIQVSESGRTAEPAESESVADGLLQKVRMIFTE